MRPQLKDWHFLAKETENNCLSSQIFSAAATRSCHKGPFLRAQIGAASKRKTLTWVRGLAFAARLEFFSRRRGVISLNHHQSKEIKRTTDWPHEVAPRNAFTLEYNQLDLPDFDKLAMNNRRLLIAAVFHFVHPEEKDSKKQQVDTKHCHLQLSK